MFHLATILLWDFNCSCNLILLIVHTDVFSSIVPWWFMYSYRILIKTAIWAIQTFPPLVCKLAPMGFWPQLRGWYLPFHFTWWCKYSYRILTMAAIWAIRTFPPLVCKHSYGILTTAAFWLVAMQMFPPSLFQWCKHSDWYLYRCFLCNWILLFHVYMGKYSNQSVCLPSCKSFLPVWYETIWFNQAW